MASNLFNLFNDLVRCNGRLTQRESAILTRWKSWVQIPHRPPWKIKGLLGTVVALFQFTVPLANQGTDSLNIDKASNFG